MKNLNSESLELVDDAEVDDEIKQADIFRDRLQVAIIDATDAIEARRTGQVPSSASFTVWAATSSFPWREVYTASALLLLIPHLQLTPWPHTFY